MNYRHAYHAGNFADVVKHLCLTLVIEHLKLKPAPFRIVDTHAGAGLYELGSIEAQKTGEWRDGIGRVLTARMPADVASILAPYLDAVASFNRDAAGGLRRYPGSPALARELMRPVDRLVVNELHPEDGAELKALFARDAQVKVLALDGWQAVKAVLPPKERRGVVLIDPPFEEGGELERLARALQDIVQRFSTGTVMLWYPIKDPHRIAAFHRSLSAYRLDKLMLVEVMLRAVSDTTRLNGAGLVLLNAPFTLQGQLTTVMPHLAEAMGDADAAWRVTAIA